MSGASNRVCGVIIDYAKQNVSAEVLAITHGRGADAVWDFTYQQLAVEQSASLVAQGGLWCPLGAEPFNWCLAW